MKIYPGNHIITGDNEQVTQSDMQLGYYKEADKNAILHVTLDESLVKLRQQKFLLQDCHSQESSPISL